MENPALISRTSAKNHHQLWFVFLILFLLFSLFLRFHYSTTFQSPSTVTTFQSPSTVTTFQSPRTVTTFSVNTTDSCHGRYVFIQDIPSRFNQFLLQNCQFLTKGSDKPNMCPYMINMGLGPEIKNENSSEVLLKNSWYVTNQFVLEVIFHNRMKRYECLTDDSRLASAVFVPSYIGLDISRFLWVNNLTVRDSSGFELLKSLVEKPEWKRMWGRDHFVVSGRISWDFRRQSDDLAYWGSKFRFLPESMNMSMLAVEGSSWKNDYAIPYPTSFHPMLDNDVYQWQSKIRHQKREFLFTFTGAPRPELEDSIRGKIIQQCNGSSLCKFVNCWQEKCDDPVNVMKVFENAVFSLQPSGDSYTRRSIFDSILAGCIPVFFNPGTAYSQYKWHFPKNRSEYSVYIPVKDVKKWKVDIAKVLVRIPEREVIAMREEVIRLIPKIVYADPRGKLDNFEDAFDIALKGILERIEKVREEIRKGRDPSIGFADEDHYKYTFSDN